MGTGGIAGPLWARAREELGKILREPATPSGSARLTGVPAVPDTCTTGIRRSNLYHPPRTERTRAPVMNGSKRTDLREKPVLRVCPPALDRREAGANEGREHTANASTSAPVHTGLFLVQSHAKRGGKLKLRSAPGTNRLDRAYIVLATLTAVALLLTGQL